MKTLSVLALILAAAFAQAAEETRAVKVYTMKDGSTVIAVRTMAVTDNGKTTYTVTAMDGKKITFDGAQVSEIADDEVPAKAVSVPAPANATANNDNAQAAKIYADFLKQNNVVLTTPLPFAENAGATQGGSISRPNNVEPYTGPNLGLQPDSADVHSHRHGYSGWLPYADGSYYWTSGNVTYVLNRSGLHRHCHDGNSVAAGTGAQWPYANNAYAYGAYYPNTPAGYAAAIAAGQNATISQVGGTFIPNTPVNTGYAGPYPGYNNWPYTGNYWDSTYAARAQQQAAGYNPYTPGLAGSNFRPNYGSNPSPVGAGQFNNSSSVAAPVIASRSNSTAGGRTFSPATNNAGGYNGCPYNQSPVRNVAAPSFGGNSFTAVRSAASAPSRASVSSGGGGSSYSGGRSSSSGSSAGASSSGSTGKSRR